MKCGLARGDVGEHAVVVSAFVAEFERGLFISVPEDGAEHLLLVEFWQERDLVPANFPIHRQAIEGLAVERERRAKTASSVPADFGVTLLFLAPRGHGNGAHDEEGEHGGSDRCWRHVSSHATHSSIPMPGNSVI